MNKKCLGCGIPLQDKDINLDGYISNIDKNTESSRLSLSALCTLRSALPVFYLGVFSSGIAYTLQNFGQSRTSPAVAGVILSMESVFAALSGYVVLGDRMTAAQSAGCIMVFFAAVFTQIFDIISSRKSDS